MLEDYNQARMSYLKAVLNNDQNKEITSLKILIDRGKRLNKNVKKYEKELRKYNGSLVSSIKIEPAKIKKPLKTNKKTQTQKPKAKISTVDVNKTKYTIKSVVDEKNAIIIEFNTKINKNYVKFYEKTINKGFQDIYDIKGNFKDAYPTKLRINGVKKIVIKQEDKNRLRILFEDKRNLKTVYHINKNILKISVLGLGKQVNKKTTAKIVKSKKLYRPGKGRVIVLDAGHGGKDSGAVGGKNRLEKKAVFQVTKYLESYLKKRGYRVYLTRNSDKYIKVKNRTVLANKKNADAFISIHANAVPKSKAKKMQGVETFFLSPARSERAKRVAALENKSDVRNMSGSTKQAFLESLNRPRITASHKLSIDIQKNMLFNARKIYKDVKDSGVREGPFWVLVGAQMPSVLIEVGYITHPTEGKRLFISKYQKALALGIANGIDSYFAKNP